MATLSELADIASDASYPALRDKIRVAAIIKAQKIADDGTATAEAQAWARDALASPAAAGRAIEPYVIGKNGDPGGTDAPVTSILSAGDTAIQNNVDAAVDNLFGA